MGIDAQLETETGTVVRQVLDERGLVEFLLGLGRMAPSLCLQSIDSYGLTVFNARQLPMLRDELARVAPKITDEALEAAKQRYSTLYRWPHGTEDEVRHHLDTLSVEQFRDHLRLLLDLVDEAIALQPHHYVRFIGD